LHCLESPSVGEEAWRQKFPMFKRRDKTSEVSYVWEKKHDVISFLPMCERRDVTSEVTFVWEKRHDIGSFLCVREETWRHKFPMFDRRDVTLEVSFVWEKRHDVGSFLCVKEESRRHKFPVCEAFYIFSDKIHISIISLQCCFDFFFHLI
jgi:hypothetical protein